MRLARACLVLLLLAPHAAARGGVTGEVAFSSDALLHGTVVLTDPDGGLDLAEAARRGEPLSLSWTGATGNLVAWPWRTVTDPTGEPYSLAGDSRNDTLRLGGGTLRRVACAGACEVLVLGPVGLRGTAEGPLRWLEEASRHWGSSSQGVEDSFVRNFTAGAFAASARPDEGATRLRDAEPFAEGRLFVFLRNATLEFDAANGSRVLVDARERASTTADALGLARAEDVEERFALLRLEGARLSAPPGGSARLLAERPTVALDGRLSASDASGRVTHAGVAREFLHAPLLVEGRLALAPGVSPRPDDAVGTLLEAPTLRARVDGEAERVVVGGVGVGSAPRAPLAAAAATGATGLAALLAALWLFKRSLFAPLYTRIGRGRVLVNENRALLHRIICEEPGVTAAELRRRVGLARMVVRHHLQTLESHGLVTRRVDGRKQRYFAADAPADDVRASPRFLLETDGRRRVFDALAASPVALTQRELAERTGLSQRLVSYHLGVLVDAGGLVVDEALPRRYAVRPEWVSRGRSAAS